MVYENLSTVSELIDKLNTAIKDKIKDKGGFNDQAAVGWHYIEDFIMNNTNSEPDALGKRQLEIIIRFDVEDRPDICLEATKLIGQERAIKNL